MLWSFESELPTKTTLKFLSANYMQMDSVNAYNKTLTLKLEIRCIPLCSHETNMWSVKSLLQTLSKFVMSSARFFTIMAYI